jgi:hypothetical protein
MLNKEFTGNWLTKYLKQYTIKLDRLLEAKNGKHKK